MFGAVVFLPLYLQVVDGASATAAGLRMLPFVVGSLVAATISGKLISKSERYKPYPIAGAVLRSVGIERTEAQQLLLSLALRGVLFAAVRLGVAGTHEAQRIQHETTPLLDDVLEVCGDLGEESMAQTAPLADLFSSTHDRLYSRLFLS